VASKPAWLLFSSFSDIAIFTVFLGDAFRREMDFGDVMSKKKVWHLSLAEKSQSTTTTTYAASTTSASF
jgi:hypothetical protein